MPTTAFTAVAPFEMIFLGKYKITILQVVMGTFEKFPG
jgi:hypothetical protein